MEEEKSGAIPYETLANAMSVNYESIYDIDSETGSYNVYYESKAFRKLDLPRRGPDFFSGLRMEAPRVVDPDDQEYVLKMLSKDAMLAGIEKHGTHRFVYRILRDGKRVYHQARVILDNARGSERILLGIIDIDDAVRQAAERREELDSERQKSANYLDAVLATAAAYADANLTTDTVEVQSMQRYDGIKSKLGVIPPPKELPRYSDFQAWICDNLLCANVEGYRKTSSRENLLEFFEQGTARASVEFSVASDEGPIPCRAVFYLYRERSTLDVRSLCVIYDLTAQQRRDKELAELKAELDISRIRNSTSQMKPHFLYNALGSIQEVMLEDPERASALLEDFTVHLRSCIKAMDSEEVIPFDQELKNIQAYVNIESMRLGDRLSVKYEIAERGFNVLPLSIQPLVENAIRHGIHKRGKAGGTVSIRTWRDGGAHFVQVEDDGVGFDVRAFEDAVSRNATDSTGIKNIRFRLQQILNARLSVSSAIGAGMVVTVRIPEDGEVK